MVGRTHEPEHGRAARQERPRIVAVNGRMSSVQPNGVTHSSQRVPAGVGDHPDHEA